MSYIDYDGSGELYITDIQKARTMDKSGLDRVITVCQDSIEDNVPDDMTYSHYRMSDGPSNAYGGDHSYEMFRAASQELHGALANDESVLIHCHMGQSRSVSVATAALGQLLDMNRTDAFHTVRRYRPTPSYPDRLLMDHASRYINEHVDVSELPFRFGQSQDLR